LGTSGQAYGGIFHIGSGNGVAPNKFDAGGTQSFRLLRGGWVLAFIEANAVTNARLIFGGQNATAAYRCAELEIAWAGCWSTPLGDTGRATVFNAVRRIAADRGIYLHWKDCPVTVDVALLCGQSNADGRALITDLTAADQLRALNPNVLIQPNYYASPEVLRLGVNQQTIAPTAQFGPEMGMAWRHEDADATRVRGLAICKLAVGSTYLAASTVGGGVTPNNSWNAGETNNAGLLWALMRQWWDMEQRLLAQGIGPRLRSLCWMQGEQDATNTIYSAGYQANLQALYDAVRLYTGYPTGLKAVVGRIRDQDLSMNTTAKAEVRAAQAAFVTANGLDAALINTDTFALAADLVHFSASGQKSLGQALYDQGGF
jgi:Carbohydrate esterase, sialic acid-specific acetylesterase